MRARRSTTSPREVNPSRENKGHSPLGNAFHTRSSGSLRSSHRISGLNQAGHSRRTEPLQRGAIRRRLQRRTDGRASRRPRELTGTLKSADPAAITSVACSHRTSLIDSGTPDQRLPRSVKQTRHCAQSPVWHGRINADHSGNTLSCQWACVLMPASEAHRTPNICVSRRRVSELTASTDLPVRSGLSCSRQPIRVL